MSNVLLILTKAEFRFYNIYRSERPRLVSFGAHDLPNSRPKLIVRSRFSGITGTSSPIRKPTAISPSLLPNTQEEFDSFWQITSLRNVI